jgi:uncharacterized protein YjbI with pentapeptide repeats
MKRNVNNMKREGFILCIIAMVLFAVPAVGGAFSMIDVNDFYLTKQCTKCDLTYGKLVGFVAPRANLVEARCKGLNLTDAVLDHSDLSGADLTDARLFGADLRGAKVQKANLRGANLIIVNFSGADLSNANLTDANLKGANLTGAKIDGADFSGATWTDWDKCKQGSIGECKK